MNINLYNTLTKNKDKFLPIKEKEVKIYSCGPTVYNRAHIGNFRTYIFNDTLIKMFEMNKYDVKHVMNITDVGHLVSDGDTGEDKMILASRREGKSPEEIARFYEDLFFEDMDALNLRRPEQVIRATDEIKAMEEYVKLLLDKGFAYETTNTVYFDTSKLDKYGVLSKIVLDNENFDENSEGQRIERDPEKRNTTDFALWIKAPENHIMKWDSFFGKSYPGWHLECSVISEKYLGKPFDIHTGGIDHIKYHHENEIAQSKGCDGVNPANYWMHAEFLVVDNEKMSKSLGNVYTLSDLEERGYSPLDFKYFVYSSNYRHKTNFTFEALDSAKKSLDRLRKLYKEHYNADKKEVDIDLDDFENRFLEAISDDLNIPVALSIVWDLARQSTKSNDIALVLDYFDEFLSLDLNKESKDEDFEFPEDVLKLKTLRDKARIEKDFELADKLRNEILDLGYELIDNNNGSNLKKI